MDKVLLLNFSCCFHESTHTCKVLFQLNSLIHYKNIMFKEAYASQEWVDLSRIIFRLNANILLISFRERSKADRGNRSIWYNVHLRVEVKSESERVSHSVMSNSLQPHGLQPSRLLYPWNSPSKNPGVDCCFLLQGIFPTQGSNVGLLHCRQLLYCLSRQGSLKVRMVITHEAGRGLSWKGSVWASGLWAEFNFMTWM